jgi:hypothetical protein
MGDNNILPLPLPENEHANEHGVINYVYGTGTVLPTHITHPPSFDHSLLDAGPLSRGRLLSN